MTPLRCLALALALVDVAGCRRVDAPAADAGADDATSDAASLDADDAPDAPDLDGDVLDGDAPDGGASLAFAPLRPSVFGAPGLYGGWVGSLAVDGRAPGTVYAAGAFPELFKTVDGGAHWSACGPDLAADTVSVDPSLAGRLIVVSRARVLLSEDACATWREIGIAPWKTTNGLSTIARVLFAPSKPSVLYAQSVDACRIDCVYRSDDGGRRWRRLFGSPGGELSISSRDPDVVIAASGEISGAVTKRSTDGGKTWSLIEGAHVPVHVFPTPTTTNATLPPIYAFGDHSIVSRDNGMTWSAWPAGPRATLGVFPNPLHPDTLLAIETQLDEASEGPAVLLRTDDVDLGWNVLEDAAPHWPRTVAWDPSDVATAYLAAAEYGVLATHDQGATWSNVSVGLAALDIARFAFASSDARTIYASSARGLIVSHDAGVTWKTLFEPGEPGLDVVIDPLDASRVWLVTDRRTVRYLQGDVLSNEAGFVGEGVSALAMTSDATRVLFVGDDAGLHRSDDGGVSWTLLPAVTTKPSHLRQIVAISTARLLVVAEDAATGKSSVLGTSNGGISWRVFPIGEPASGASSIAAVNGAPRTFLVSVKDVKDVKDAADEGDAKLMRTTDAGLSWTEVLPHGTSPVISTTDASVAYAMTRDGLARSHDGGATWSAGAKSATGASALAIDRTDPNVVWASFSGAYVSKDGGLTFTKWR